MTFLTILSEVLLVTLLADFLAGFLHWIEDAYIREDTPFVGRLIGRPNVIHHHLPRLMTRNTWLQSSWDLLCLAGFLLLTAWWFDVLTWQLTLFAVLCANANEVHKWSHRTRVENGPFISALQDLRLLQTPRHHAVHHTHPKNVRYCPITNWLNPVLDRCHFWIILETSLAWFAGLHRRPDTSLPNQGPVPPWLMQVRKEWSSYKIEKWRLNE